MYIYNVTINITDARHQEWLQWMQQSHIPDVMATNLFEKHQLVRVLVNEEEGTTYSIQYYVKDKETLQLYQEVYAPKLQQEHKEKFEGHFVAFRTLLEVVE